MTDKKKSTSKAMPDDFGMYISDLRKAEKAKMDAEAKKRAAKTTKKK